MGWKKRMGQWGMVVYDQNPSVYSGRRGRRIVMSLRLAMNRATEFRLAQAAV